MRICAVVKYPPIQGGVSTQSYWMCRLLAARGHQVHVVTNAGEVEPEYRAWLLDGDQARLTADFPNGGLVRVRTTGGFDQHGRFGYIPAANPFTTKLASMAAEVVREHDCDLIAGWYLEPYGLAANLASSWTGRPFVVRHAGSDRNALMAHPELTTAYKEVLRSAAGVLTTGMDFSGFGIPPERTVEVPGTFRPAEFSPSTGALDVNAVLRQLAAEGCPYVVNTAPFEDRAPTIGIYGKTGPTKGTFDVIAALGDLRRRGVGFQFLVMGAGRHWQRMIAAAEDHGIAEVTWTLPFLAPWQVPGFVRACTAVCFLERGFAIKRHMPGLAREILACGVPLVVSAEIAEKQPFHERLIDGVNHHLVRDPADHGELAGVLARVIADPAAARERGLAGAAVLDRTDDDDFGRRYEQALTGVLASRDGQVPANGSRPAGWLGTEALLRSHCPATARLLGEELPGVLGGPEDDGTLLGVYRITHRLLLSGRLRGDGPELQSARAEHHLLWFAVDVEGADGVAVYPIPTFTLPDLSGFTDERLRALRPVASRLLRIERFGIDVAGYARRLAGDAEGSADPPLEAGDERPLLFHKRPQLGGSVLKIDEPTARVLRACDGTSTVASLAGSTQGAPIPSSLRRLVQTLHESGAIVFAGHQLLTAPSGPSRVTAAHSR